jgi:hypothetical protein
MSSATEEAIMNPVVFLSLRALHVLVAAVWIGSTIFISSLLVPAVDASGLSGGQVMMRMNRRGLATYMTVLGATTVLTGVYLLWRFTGGFDPAVGATHAGLAFGIGGIAGILAGIIGGGVVGRSSAKVTNLLQRVGMTMDGPEKDAIVLETIRLKRRMKAGSLAVTALQATALVLMAVGHYV